MSKVESELYSPFQYVLTLYKGKDDGDGSVVKQLCITDVDIAPYIVKEGSLESMLGVTPEVEFIGGAHEDLTIEVIKWREHYSNTEIVPKAKLKDYTIHLGVYKYGKEDPTPEQIISVYKNILTNEYTK